MRKSGTSTHFDPDDFRFKVRGVRANLVFACRGDFKARLTWVELRHLRLLRVCENLPRIAYLALAREEVFITFPTHSARPQIWGGVKLKSGDILLHAAGERMHQRAGAANRWGFISLPPEQLASYGKTLAGRDLAPPSVGRILRPPLPAIAQLLYLHAKACDLAEKAPETFAHREVARALEQDLAHALVNCLVTSTVQDDATAWKYRCSTMVRFEEALAGEFHRPAHVPDVCAAIGVSERTLRMCSSKVLGMGPNRYLRLRRLNLARAELRRADGGQVSVADVANRFGFSELGRFAATYRIAFGETPSTTLWRPRNFIRDAASADRV